MAKKNKTRAMKKVAAGVRPKAGPKPISKLDEDIKRIEAEISRYKHALRRPEKVVSAVVVSAKKLEKKVKKEIKKEVKEKVKEEIKEGVKVFDQISPGRRKSGSLVFYFISSLVCVALLSFLFGSIDSFVFYFAFGLFLWWWSHQFHTARSGLLKTVLSLGLLVVFLYLFYWIFNDLLSLLVCLIYALSFVIAALLYFYHVKRELSGEIHRSFSRTFLVVFYSHIMAFTAASVVAFLLPEIIISDSFVSMIFVFLAWLLPALLVYFFLTKFLYLRFFDRKHIKRDLLKGFAHGMVYALVFIALLVFAYLLTAIQFVFVERAAHDETFSDISAALHDVKSDISAADLEYGAGRLRGLRVTRDIVSLSEQILQNSSDIESMLGRTAFSFEDYFSDNYFTVLSGNRIYLSSIAGIASGVDDVKEDLIREYRRMKEFESRGEFDDRTTSLEEHRLLLADDVSSRYVPYSKPLEFADLRQKISSSLNSYSGLVEDGELLEFNLAYHPGLSVLEAGDSRFSKRFYDVMYHTVLFRDLMLLVFNSMLLHVEETIDPYAVKALYHAADGESVQSSVLRYRIIKSNLDAAFALAEG